MPTVIFGSVPICVNLALQLQTNAGQPKQHNTTIRFLEVEPQEMCNEVNRSQDKLLFICHETRSGPRFRTSNSVF